MNDKKFLNITTYGSYNQIPIEHAPVNIKFIDSNRIVEKEDSIWPKHTHFNYEIIFVENGNYKCVLNKRKLQLQPFDIILIQSGQQHEDILEKGVRWYSFHFRLYMQNNQEIFFFKSETSPQEQIIHLDDNDCDFFTTMISIFEKEAVNSLNQNYSVHSALFNAVFKKIISLIPDKYKNEQFIDHNSLKNEEQRIISVFNKLLTVQPTLSTLCKMCSMSRSSLHRNCMHYFNMPPRKAFSHFKMSHVAEFIRKNPHLSIKEISETFGFKNQFHFSRTFKQELGYHPSMLHHKYIKK